MDMASPAASSRSRRDRSRSTRALSILRCYASSKKDGSRATGVRARIIAGPASIRLPPPASIISRQKPTAGLVPSRSSIASLPRSDVMPTIPSRWLDIVLRGRRERRLADEVQSHLDFLTDEFIAKGMSSEEARLAARKSFGGVDQMKAVYRDQRGFPFIDSVSQDVRYAVRGLRRTPTFTIVCIVILALAIGANAGVVSLLNALLVRELAVREPSSLVQVAFTTSQEADGPLTYTMFQELSGRQHVFSAVMGWTGAAVRDVEVDGAIASAAVFSATGNWFTELGVRPAMGRLLNNSDMSLA